MYNNYTRYDTMSLLALRGLDISPEGALFTDDDVHEGIAITKDLFLLVIQDLEVNEKHLK